MRHPRRRGFAGVDARRLPSSLQGRLEAVGVHARSTRRPGRRTARSARRPVDCGAVSRLAGTLRADARNSGGDLMIANRQARTMLATWVTAGVSCVLLAIPVAGRSAAQNGSPLGNGGAWPRFDRMLLLETTSDFSANVSIGDLDGDGIPDVVLAKGRHNPLVDRVLFNDGLGGFPVTRDLGVADRSYAAALADLDRDGDLDIVVGN